MATLSVRLTMLLFRKSAAIAAAVMIAILALILIAIPYLRPQPFGQAGAVLTLIALACGGRLIWQRPSWHILVLPIIGLCILPGLVITNHFGRFDLISVMHHVNYGGGGPDARAFGYEIQDGVLSLGCFTLAVYWLCNLLRLSHWWYWGAAAVVIAVINPMSVSMARYAFAPSVDLGLAARLGPPQVTTPAVLPDVIMIYLEGLDRSFADQARYGDAYAGLLPVQAEGLDLTQIGQIAGTGWSIAGIVATQCGVPLLPNGMRNRNSFEAQTAFLPAQTCLSDILADHGYHSTYIVAANAAFAGQDHFMRSHQYDQIIDHATLRDWYDPDQLGQAYVAGAKAYDDQMAFEAAARHYDEMIASPSPISMSIMTYGPHGQSGVLSRHCASDGRARAEPDLHQTVPCSISDALTLLDHIRASRGGRPTFIALMSDHLNHKPDSAVRMNTVTFLGLGLENFPAGKVNTQPGAMIDVYPTTLALLGFIDPDAPAGLGQSVLGTTPTLVAQHGVASLDRGLETDLALRLALWR